MSWVDIAIIVIVFISAVVSLFRGLIREAFSLAAWIIAFWVAWFFHAPLADMLRGTIALPSIRSLVAFGILFLVTLLICALVNHLLTQLVDKTGLSGTDRLLGLLFGLARGVLIVAVLVLIGRSTVLANDPWWDKSQFIQHFDVIADEIVRLYRQYIDPAEISDVLKSKIVPPI